MFNNILIPVALDHERDLGSAIAIARHLLGEGGHITLVGVAEQVPGYVAEYVMVHPDGKLRDVMAERLRDLARREPGVDVAVMAGKPGVAIADFAAARGADLIIIGSHRPGAQDYFLGSTASRVVRRAPCAVMVLRDS